MIIFQIPDLPLVLLLEPLQRILSFPIGLLLDLAHVLLMPGGLLLSLPVTFLLVPSELLGVPLLHLSDPLLVLVPEFVGRLRQPLPLFLHLLPQFLEFALQLINATLHLSPQEVAVLLRLPLDLVDVAVVLALKVAQFLLLLGFQTGLKVLKVHLEFLSPLLQL